MNRKIEIFKYFGLALLIGFLGAWRGFGSIKFKINEKAYELLIVDIITYTTLGICGLAIIWF